LGGLLGDAHGLADLGPRCAIATSLIHEVADQVIRQFAQLCGRDDRGAEVVQCSSIRMLVANVLDQIVQPGRE
jgi:hypothetical protein